MHFSKKIPQDRAAESSSGSPPCVVLSNFTLLNIGKPHSACIFIYLPLWEWFSFSIYPASLPPSPVVLSSLSSLFPWLSWTALPSPNLIQSLSCLWSLSLGRGQVCHSLALHCAREALTSYRVRNEVLGFHAAQEDFACFPVFGTLNAPMDGGVRLYRLLWLLLKPSFNLVSDWCFFLLWNLSHASFKYKSGVITLGIW